MNTVKFKLSKLPNDLTLPVIIKRIYFDFSLQDVREELIDLFDKDVCQSNSDAYITATVTATEKQFECTVGCHTVKIQEVTYDYLKMLPYNGMIFKISYTIPILGTELAFTIDNHIGSLMGLIVAHIQYDDEKNSKESIFEYAEKYLGADIIDVSSDSKYNDDCLARLNNIIVNKNKQ